MSAVVVATGEELLASVLLQKQNDWQKAQLDSFASKGKEQKNDKWKDKYKGPAEPDVERVDDLPSGWVWASAEAICESVRDGTHGTPKYVSDGVPLITSKNLIDGQISFEKIKFISQEDHAEISKRSGVESGDILFAMIGTIGNPVVVSTDAEFSIKNVGLFKRNEAYIEPRYLRYWLESPALDKWLTPRLKGTTQKFVPLGLLRAMPVPVAPRDQQVRIVAEIEKQFSRLDEADASLKRVKANLKRYKAAVLKAAVEGKLTEEWRKQNPDVEPASKLLERILAERRTRWEEVELAKMKAKGKEPKNDKWKEKYKESLLGQTDALSEIPEGWVVTRLDQVAEIKGGITKDSKRKANSVETLPYLRVANVQRGWIDISEMKEIDVPSEKVADLLLEPGDILFNEGGDRDKLGRGWVWEGQIERCIYQNHVFRARLVKASVIEPKFVSWYGNGVGQRFFMARGKQTTNLASINKTMLSSLPIPIPPAAEQSEIRKLVEDELSRLDELEVVAGKTLLRAGFLRQSVLSEAFSGRMEKSNR